MKLVNGIKEARLKREVHKLISAISPEHLTHKNLKLALQRFLEVGAISREEMKVIETQVIGTTICYRIENIFKEFGYDIMAQILFFDKEKEDKGLTMYHVAGPHLPDGWIEALNGYTLTTDWEKYYLSGDSVDKIIHVPEARSDDRLHAYCRSLMIKYALPTAIYFPLCYGDERLGNIVIVSTEKIEYLPDQLMKRLTKKGDYYNRELTRLQNEWFGLRIRSAKGVIGLDDVIRYCTDDIEDMIGYDAQTCMRGKIRSVFIHPDDQWHFYKAQLKVVEKKETVRIVYRCKHATLGWVVLDTIFEPVMTQKGKVDAIRFEAFINTPACKEFEAQLYQEA